MALALRQALLDRLLLMQVVAVVAVILVPLEGQAVPVAQAEAEQGRVIAEQMQPMVPQTLAAAVVAVGFRQEMLVTVALVALVLSSLRRQRQQHRLQALRLLQHLAGLQFTHLRAAARLHSEVDYGALCKG